MDEKIMTPEILENALNCMSDYVKVFFDIPFILADDKTIKKAKTEEGLTIEDIDVYIPFQLNDMIPIMEDEENKNISIALNKGYYFIKEKEPFNVYVVGEGNKILIGQKDNEEANVREFETAGVDLFKMDNGTEKGLTFFQLLVDIYSNKPFKPSDKKKLYKLLEPFILKEDIKSDFFSILNSPALNSLATIRTKQFLPAQLDLYGNAEIQEGENFKLTIKNYLELPNGLPASSLQLLDCFLIIFTRNPLKETKIRLPLKEYMEMRGLSDPKSARQQVLKDMEVLSKISYQAKEKIKGKWVESGDISIFGGTKMIKNKVIYFNFNLDFYNALMNYSISDYSKEALKIDTKRKPHAYYFLKYIDTNYRLNEGKDRLSTISLGTLIRKSPQLPTYEEVMKSNKNIYDRIIKCTIDNLDSIDFLYFDIVDPEGNIVEDPYTFFKGRGSYELFIHSSLKIDYSDYPTHPERIKKRKKYSSKNEKK